MCVREIVMMMMKGNIYSDHEIQGRAYLLGELETSVEPEWFNKSEGNSYGAI